jgi:hypothetical protein
MGIVPRYSLDLQGVGMRTSQEKKRGRWAHRQGTLLCFLYASELLLSNWGKMFELDTASGSGGVHSGSCDHLYNGLNEQDRAGQTSRCCLVEKPTDDRIPKMEVTRGLALELLVQKLGGRYLRRWRSTDER